MPRGEFSRVFWLRWERFGIQHLSASHGMGRQSLNVSSRNMNSRSSIRFPIPSDAYDNPYLETIRDLGATRGSRSTQEHPNWYRCDGKGYTIWISEPVIWHEDGEPALWDIQIEALSGLNDEGSEFMSLALETFLRRYDRLGAYAVEHSNLKSS